MRSALDAWFTLSVDGFKAMARTGGLFWYRLGIWPCTRYGGRDRGESGESAARMKYHSHGIPCPVMSSLVSASCTPSTGLYRVYSTGYRVGSTRYKRRVVSRLVRPSVNSCSQGHASASFYRSIQKIVNTDFSDNSMLHGRSDHLAIVCSLVSSCYRGLS